MNIQNALLQHVENKELLSDDMILSMMETLKKDVEAFDIADYYRNPVMVVGDGMIGQMMEPIEFNPPAKRDLPNKDEQPGPPLSHNVTGSELLTLLAASTKT